VVAAVASRPTTERWHAAWRILARASTDTPDVAATAARVLVRSKPPDAALPPELKAFLPVLRDAGLLPG
jgi:hypothetical protein